MKRLFGQRPKTSKTPSQVNPIPTPIPVDEFARAAQQKTSPQDDPWIVVPDQVPGATGPVLQNRSRSVSFTSVLPGATILPQPVPGANNALYQQQAYAAPYDGNLQPPNHSLLTPNSNHNHSQPLKKKSPTIHDASAILRSLDPEQSNLEGSVSPSQESLQLNGDTEREHDPRIAERDYEAERERERQREWERGRERERERERGRERIREHKRDSERDRYQERDQDRGRDRDKDRDRPKEKERKKGLFGAARDKDKDKERERTEQAELTRMIGKFMFRPSEAQIQTSWPSGYLTATASEDWALVLEVCERASTNEAAAKDVSKALRREFK